MAIRNETQLLDSIYKTVAAFPDGLSEHELLKVLKKSDISFEIENPFENNHALFRAHFILFHLLYRLRNTLWQQKQAHMEISPLNIQVLPYQAGYEHLDHYDELMDYYLDLSNLENTTANDVEEMLGAFYTRLSNQDKRQDALQTLGLEDPVSDQTIKKQYRRLAMQHHPDRGGDTERLQTIHAAMNVLVRS